MGCGGSKHAVDTADATATIKKSSSSKEVVTDNVIPETAAPAPEPAVAAEEKAGQEPAEVVAAAVPDVVAAEKELKEETAVPVSVPVPVTEEIGSTAEAKKEEAVVVAEAPVSDKPVEEEKVVAETPVSDKPVEEKAPAVKEEIAVTESSSSSTETPKAA